MQVKKTKPNANQRIMIKRRCLDPNNYLVLKDSKKSLYLLDIRYNKVKIIFKYN